MIILLSCQESMSLRCGASHVLSSGIGGNHSKDPNFMYDILPGIYTWRFRGVILPNFVFQVPESGYEKKCQQPSSCYGP